jgi:hypothetical protein
VEGAFPYRSRLWSAQDVLKIGWPNADDDKVGLGNVKEPDRWREDDAGNNDEEPGAAENEAASFNDPAAVVADILPIGA